MRRSRARSTGWRARSAVAIPAAALLAALLSGTATAAVLWDLQPLALSAQTSQPTTFTLTATNRNPTSELGCVQVDVTPSFAINDAAITSVSNGGTWLASWQGKVVTIRAQEGGDRLARLPLLVPPEWVRFTISATGQAPGVWTWQGTAFRQQDCSGTPFLDLAPVIVTVSGPRATPTPTPTPTPTATPTPTLPLPTLTPTLPPIDPTLPPPIDVLPSLLPTSTPRPTPTLAPDGSQSPGATPVPGSDRATPEPSRAPDGSAAGQSSSGGSRPPGPPTGSESDSRSLADGLPPGGTGGLLPGVRSRDAAASAPNLWEGLAGFGVSALGVAEPLIVFTVPGLLIILLVLLQMGGTAIWIPFVRRFRQPEHFLGPGALPRNAAASRARLGSWTTRTSRP